MATKYFGAADVNWCGDRRCAIVRLVAAAI